MRRPTPLPTLDQQRRIFTREGTAGASKWLGAGLAVVIVIAVALRLGFLGV